MTSFGLSELRFEPRLSTHLPAFVPLAPLRSAPLPARPSYGHVCRRAPSASASEAWAGELAAATAAKIAIDRAASGAAGANTAAGGPPLLELRDLRYVVPFDSRKRLFLGANLTVRKHQFVLVIGENGAGKSTLFKLIMGFLNPTSGQILWRNEELRRKKKARRDHLAIVMQRPVDFFLGRSILEELTIGFKGATPQDVRAVLTAVGLGEISLLQKPRELSGGQQKRLAIAVQLMRARPRVRPVAPELFLLDEPMAGVDVIGRRDLARLLASLTDSFALVVVSHEPGELLDYADRVVQLSRGQLIEVDQKVLARARKINAQRAQLSTS